MQNINEVFKELDSRIDLLRNFSMTLNVWGFLKREFNINSIERNIYRFEKEAVPRLSISLDELKELEDRGTSILCRKAFYKEWDIDHIITDEEEIEIDQKKERAYNLIKAEITFYIKKLTELRSKIKSQNRDIDCNDNTQVISVGTDFKFPELKVQYPGIVPVLSKDQLALLFHYLKESKIILPYDDTSMSKLAMFLTGFSDKTLRQDSFGKIYDLKKEIPGSSKKSGNNQSNLEILRDTIKGMLKEIDKEIKSTPPNK